MKKLISLVMSLVMVLASSITVFANDLTSFVKENLTAADVIVSAAMHLNSSNNNEDILKRGSYLKNITPLYYNGDSVVAYYVTFNPTGYAVVNNNANNPAVIEFGDGVQEEIEKNISTQGKIFYNNPVDVYSEGDISVKSMAYSLYTYFPELLEEDAGLVQEISSAKSLFINNIKPMGDGDYGFYDLGSMPGGSYSSDLISYASSTDWINTDDVSDIARDHCGATAVTNLALYFAKRGKTNLKIDDSKRSTFIEVHKIIGNGPVMMIAGGATQYFSNRGYTLNHSSIGSYSGVKTAIGNNRILGILLADGIVSWHWILGVGYRQYTSGENYIRIMDGWHNTVDKYYKINSGSMWWSATQYWVS